MFFFISYIVLTYHIYNYCIWLGFNPLFSCSFAGCILFSPMAWVTGCDSSLGSFFCSPVYFLSRMHVLSCYYYYDYVVIGVLRPSWRTEILFWIGLQLSKEVKHLKIILLSLYRYIKIISPSILIVSSTFNLNFAPHYDLIIIPLVSIVKCH